MEEDIKILKEIKEEYDDAFGTMIYRPHSMDTNEVRALQNILNRLEQLEKENEELKTTYRKIAAHFNKTGKEELAEYMLAQIEDIPVWTVD